MLPYSYGPPRNPIPYLFMTKRHVYVRSILKNSRVLDIGCNKYKVTSQAIGLDISPLVHPNVVSSAMKLPFHDESLDSVTALEVIEHFTLDKQDTFLSEVYRVLRAKGQFIVSTPNMSERTRKLHDFLFFISHSVYARKDVHGHVGELTHYQLITKLENFHFKIISEKAFSLFNYVVECDKP